MVSPYHLATREAPAMLALMLGDEVVTLMPQPAQGTSKEAVRQTMESVPRYFRLMESWRWSGPLWQKGVIANISRSGGHDPLHSLDAAYAQIAADDQLSALRPLVKGAQLRAAEGPNAVLDALAGDVLRGGPDPGINIPVAAAIDRFASEQQYIVVRSGASSLAQRAESKLALRIFAVALPMLLRAGGGRLLRLRTDLFAPLSELRQAIQHALNPALATELDRARAVEAVHRAAATYVRAFEAWSDLGARGDDENEERITRGYVSLVGVLMPPDAVFRASCAAVRAIQGNNSDSTSPRNAAENPTPQRIPSLIVREMNLRPEPAAD